MQKLCAPPLVLWFYFEGNDLTDMLNESKESILMNYLDKGFNQNLRLHQPFIDRLLTQYIEQEQVEQERIEQEQIDTVKNISNQKIMRFVRLARLRQFFDFDKNKTDCKHVDLSLFSSIMEKASNSVKEWDGNLIFVYLPSHSRYSGKVYSWEHCSFTNRDEVLAIANSLSIPTIDVHSAFLNSKEPKANFPFGLYGHYNAQGYQVASEHIIEQLGDLGYTLK